MRLSRPYAAVSLCALFLVPAQNTTPEPAAHPTLTNLAHLDFLTDTVTATGEPGHTTFRLDSEPTIGVVWTYAEPPSDSSSGSLPDASATTPSDDEYIRLGGGDYDVDADTYGQGAFNADDMARAAVVYLRHWEAFGDDHSRVQAYDLLRGLTYLQTGSGPHAGNVVLWMQPDGALNPSAEPAELPDPSDSDASYWLARTIWALGEGYRAFQNTDPDFAAFLGDRFDLAIAALERDVLGPNYGEWHIVDGLQWPSWLIADGADASAEAIYGLVAYIEAGGSAPARRALDQLGEGLAAMQLGGPDEWPFGAIMPWAQSRSVWHAWGDQMAGALASAGAATDRPDWIAVAIKEVAGFTPHLLAQGGPDNGWQPAPADRSQIAYGADATLHNLVNAAEASGLDAFNDLAGVAAAWYFGNNPAGAVMYDVATGRTFDGVNADKTVNRNSGAESTIHGLLSMILLDEHPDLAARATAATREEHRTWQLVEAEAGELRGTAQVVTPDSPWTGESLWSGGAYVVLPTGDASVEIPVEPPARDQYHLFGVSWHDAPSTGSVELTFEMSDVDGGSQPQGGAGPQGVTAVPGYLGVESSATSAEVDPQSTTLTVTAVGQGDDAELDAVLVQPDIEWLILSGDDTGQALLHSFSSDRRTEHITIDGASGLEARSYDAEGRLASTNTSPHDWIEAPIQAGGFTLLTTQE